MYITIFSIYRLLRSRLTYSNTFLKLISIFPTFHIYNNMTKMKGGIKAFKNARYLTRGVQSKIPVKLQIFMWSCIESVSEADYLQIFRLEPIETIQKITHEQEQPQFNRKYLIPTDHPITAKVYIIDDGEHSIMLLANEY